MLKNLLIQKIILGMKQISDNASEFILYTSKNGEIKIDVVLQDETIWLSQKRMGKLFGVESHTITYHLKEIYRTEELKEGATTRKIRVVQKEGNRSVKRWIDFYNLDAIIAIGYRVNSYQATQFQIWATKTLKEYIIKGFVLDDEREIRTSERRFYQKVTDIYAQCSIDYDASSPLTRKFYATVQNKLHWAITKMTAAEIVYNRVNAKTINMGLTTWKMPRRGKS